jgi:hypothetical protein
MDRLTVLMIGDGDGVNAAAGLSSRGDDAMRRRKNLPLGVQTCWKVLQLVQGHRRNQEMTVLSGRQTGKQSYLMSKSKVKTAQFLRYFVALVN